jgi:hypothetical protein
LSSFSFRSRGHFKRQFRREPAAPMRAQTKNIAPVKKPAWTIQRAFDKWFLPTIFVAIGSLIVWAIWRH